MPTQELGCQSQAGLRGSGWDSGFPNPLEGGAHGQLGAYLEVFREYHLLLVLVLPQTLPSTQTAGQAWSHSADARADTEVEETSESQGLGLTEGRRDLG